MQKYILFGIKVAAIALVIFVQTLETRATWGNFDTSFGFAGVAFDSVTGHHPQSVALQTDGKFLVTGYRTTLFAGKGFFLRRYLSDGQIDTSFGTNGGVIGPEANFRGSDYRGNAIVVQANGKIAVAGWANGYHAVWQFTSSGKADKTFGDGGLQVLSSYRVINNYYPEMNIQSGKLLLSVRKQIGSDRKIAVVRLNSNATLDTHFGNAGESLTGIYGGDKGSGTVVETDGKITIGGIKYNDLNAKGLERKLANGQDDLTFSPPTIFSFGAVFPGLVKMDNGKYAMRWGNLGANSSITLVLETFNSAGVFESSVSPYNGNSGAGCPEVFTKQNDGKLIVQFLGFLFRLNDEIEGGSIEMNDCSNLGGMTHLARASIQSDDKMVVAGVYNNYLMLARLLPN